MLLSDSLLCPFGKTVTFDKALIVQFMKSVRTLSYLVRKRDTSIRGRLRNFWPLIQYYDRLCYTLCSLLLLRSFLTFVFLSHLLLYYTLCEASLCWELLGTYLLLWAHTYRVFANTSRENISLKELCSSVTKIAEPPWNLSRLSQ